MKQPELGKFIAEQRVVQSLTQLELADKCKVNIRTIQRIETGDVMPRSYTLNLLCEVLNCDFNNQVQDSTQNTGMKAKLMPALIGGIIYMLNAVFVVYDLITKGLNNYPHIITSVVHIISCVVFFGGFYLIGRFYKNRLLAIGAIIMMVLLPVINILYLLNNVLLNATEGILFILMSLNMLVIAAGLIVEGLKYSDRHKNLSYTIAAVLTVIISAAYLSLQPYVIYIGLIVSFPANAVLVSILYKERDDDRQADVATNVLSLYHQHKIF